MTAMWRALARKLVLAGLVCVLIAGMFAGTAAISTRPHRRAASGAATPPRTPSSSRPRVATASSAVEGMTATRSQSAAPATAPVPQVPAATPAPEVLVAPTPAQSTESAAPIPLPPLQYEAVSRLGIAAAATVSRARAADPNYAGAWLDGADILHLATAGDPAILNEVAASSGMATAVEVRTTPRSRLLAVRNDIASRAYELAGNGLSLVALSIADAPNAVRLTAVVTNPASQDQLRAQYPDVTIEVHQILDGAVATRGAPRSSSSLGVQGGVVISPAARPSYRCVAGFAVTTSRGRGITTAGHCGRAGEAFLLGNGPDSTRLGTVAARVNDQANVQNWPGQRVTATDIEVIDTPAATSTVLFDDRTVPVRGIITQPVVGQIIYASLGRTGSTTPGRVTEVDVITIGTPDGTMPTTIDDIGISNCANPGDSGAPVVAVAENQTVQAIGLVIATPDAQCSLDPLAAEHESETYVSLIAPSLNVLGAQLAE